MDILVIMDLGVVTPITKVDYINSQMHHNHGGALANMMHVQSSQ